MSEQPELSEREIEILKLVATGASNKEIAQQLYISPNTVKVHLKNIFSKIGATSRTEAAMYVVQHGLVQPTEAAEGAFSSDGAPAGAVPAEGLETASRSGPFKLAGWGAAGLLFLIALLALIIFVQQRQGPANPASPSATESPRWSARAGLPTARFGLAVVVYGDALFALAGETQAGVTGVVERYDTETDRWEALTPKPLPVADVSAAVLGGKIFVPGGRTSDGSVTDQMEIYDPLEDHWTDGTPLPLPVSAYALAVFEGKLFLFGGWDGEQVLDTVFEYDPDREAWTERSPMPTGRAFAGADVAGRTIYVIGGFDGEQALAVNEAYQPDLDSGSQNPWEQKAPLPQPRYAFGIASIADTLSLLGGQGDGLEEEPGLVYRPNEDEWQRLQAPQAEMGYGLRLAATGPHLYLLGGKLDGDQGEMVSAGMYVYQAFYTVSFPVIEK